MVAKAVRQGLDQCRDLPEDVLPDAWGLTVLAPNCQVEDGRRVPPGVMLDRNGKEVSR